MASRIVEEYGDERATEALQQGIQQGAQQQAEEIARKALAMKLPPEQVSQLTGLSKERILEFEKNK